MPHLVIASLLLSLSWVGVSFLLSCRQCCLNGIRFFLHLLHLFERLLKRQWWYSLCALQFTVCIVAPNKDFRHAAISRISIVEANNLDRATSVWENVSVTYIMTVPFFCRNLIFKIFSFFSLFCIRNFCTFALERQVACTAGKATSLFFGRQYEETAALTSSLSFQCF